MKTSDERQQLTPIYYVRNDFTDESGEAGVYKSINEAEKSYEEHLKFTQDAAKATMQSSPSNVAMYREFVTKEQYDEIDFSRVQTFDKSKCDLVKQSDDDQLSHALQASRNVHPHSHVGVVVHVDERHVYQLSQKGVVQHNRNVWNKEPVVGQNYEVAYSRGVGKVKSELTQDEAQKLNNRQSKSCSL